MAIVIVVGDSLAMALVHDKHIIKLLRFPGPVPSNEIVIRQMIQ